MSVFIESGFVSLHKYGEELCGDKVESIYYDDTLTLVLADGLGSGVKANILASLTSKIICTMMANGMSIEDCVETIASTLPVCSQREIAYSTFSILQVKKDGNAYLVQFDNPKVIFIRDGKSVDYEVNTKEICGKKIQESRFVVRKDDKFILFSDGVIHAGVGKILNFGWQHENVVKFIEENYDAKRSAKSTALLLADACNNLYMEKPGDDTTVAVMRIREVSPVNLIIGPPVNKEDDTVVAKEFMSMEGKHIVCGGTTSKIISNYLNQEVVIEMDYADPSIPPIGRMKGVELVTEGVLTIGKVLELAKRYLEEDSIDNAWLKNKDGATRIAKLLFEDSTDVNFFVGRAMNPAHQNPKLPIDLSIKLKLIEELAEKLKIMGKRVTLKFF